MLTNDARTLLKGGVGLFYDRVPLNIASFPLLPDRTVVNLASTGQIIDFRTVRKHHSVVCAILAV
jgi:hypothetical protein